MLQTMDIDYIVNELKINLFDFEYNFVGFDYKGRPINKGKLETMFINRFLYYQIGYSTVEEFIWRLKNVWLENIESLNMKLTAMSNIGLDDPQILFGSRLTEGTTRVKSDADTRYSDTPNQKMFSFEENNGYLTDRTLNRNTGDSSYQDFEGGNFVKTYGEIKGIFKDPIQEFFNKFNNLFVVDIILNNIFVR